MKSNFIEPNVDISIVFNKKNIIKYLKLAIPLLIMLVVYELYVFHNIYKNNIKLISNGTSKIIKYSPENKKHKIINTLARILNVKYVLINNKCYKCVNGNFKNCNYKYIPFLDTYIIKDKYTIIKNTIDGNDYVYIINDIENIKYILYIIMFNIIVLFLIFTIIFFIYVYKEEKTSLIEKITYELDLEGSLQRTLAESAHHEMLMPLSVIKTIFNDFILKLYPCANDKTKQCIFVNNNNEKKDCAYKQYNRDIDKVSKEYITSIHLAIEQLEVVLNQMSETKQLKHSIGNISIYKLITNAVNTINTSSVTKLILEMRIEDKELLKKYAVKKPLSNGNMLNILNNHLSNSKDANSTIIRIKSEITKNDMLELYLGDNGKGIRNKYDEIITKDDVFNNGYSTKNNKGESIIIKRTFFNRVKEFIKHFLKDENIKTGRGFGLFINKKILNKAGGNIELVDTSIKGTVFKLTIPIKIKKNDIK